MGNHDKPTLEIVPKEQSTMDGHVCQSPTIHRCYQSLTTIEFERPNGETTSVLGLQTKEKLQKANGNHEEPNPETEMGNHDKTLPATVHN